jgi:hypothetical protein
MWLIQVTLFKHEMHKYEAHSFPKIKLEELQYFYQKKRSFCQKPEGLAQTWLSLPATLFSLTAIWLASSDWDLQLRLQDYEVSVR